MSVDQNLKVFRRFVDEGLNNRNIDGIHREICATDLVMEAPGVPTEAGKAQGFEIFKEAVLGFTDAFPDVRCTLPYLVGEGETVAADISYHGHHEHEFQGVPPSHQDVHGGELWFVEFQNGKMKNVRICEYGTPLRTAMIAAGAHGAHP